MQSLTYRQELRKCFLERNAKSLVGFDATRRAQIVKALEDATSTTGTSLSNVTDVSQYFLLEGHSLGHKPTTGEENTMQPYEWLESIRLSGKAR